MIFVAQIGDWVTAVACTKWETEAGVLIVRNGDKVVASAPAGGQWIIIPEAAYESMRKTSDDEKSLFENVFGKR